MGFPLLVIQAHNALEVLSRASTSLAHLKHKKVEFIIEPYIRFEGLAGEQATLFFYDPSGNALEFKAFKDSCQIFTK